MKDRVFDFFETDYFYPREDRLKKGHIYNELCELGIDFENKTLLDLGCDQGYYLMALQNFKPKTLVGCDIRYSVLEEAYINLKRYGHHAPLTQLDISNLPFKDRSVDIIICFLVLAYVKNEEAAVKEIHRILKEKGIFVLSVAGPGYPLQRKIRRGGLRTKLSGILSICSTLIYMLTDYKIKRDTVHTQKMIKTLLGPNFHLISSNKDKRWMQRFPEVIRVIAVKNS